MLGIAALLRSYIGTLLHQRTYGKPAAIPNVDLVLQLLWLVVTGVRVDPLVRAKPEIAGATTATVSAAPLVAKMGSSAQRWLCTAERGRGTKPKEAGRAGRRPGRALTWEGSRSPAAPEIQYRTKGRLES